MLEQRQSQLSPKNADSIYRFHILYMEDDLGLGSLLKKKLERMACMVEVARDGREGLLLCEKNNYDIIISDYNMPIVNGLDVIKQLKDSVPVIILTGQGDEMVAVEAMKLGAADYITKDANGEYLEILPSIIDRVLERQQLISDRRQAKMELQASEARYRAIVEDQTEMICRFEPDGKLTFANAAFCRYFGIRQTDVVFQNVASILSRRAFQYIKDILKTLDPQNPAVMKTHELKMLDGRVHWVQWTGRAIFIDASTPKEYQLVGRDITDLKGIEAALRASEEKNNAIINAIPDPIFRISKHGNIVDLWYKEGQGINVPADLVGKHISEFFSSDVTAQMLEHSNNALVDGVNQVFQFDFEQDGHVSRYEARLVCAGGDDILIILRDVTEHSKLEQHLQYLSIHDSLTGLYNRAYFTEELRRLSSGRYDPVGIVMCDVDGLKIINDTLGHVVGDEMLKTAATMIYEVFRREDIVARIGGDEFAIILPTVSQTIVTEACTRLRMAIDEYNKTEPKLSLSISIGAAVSSPDVPNLNDVLKRADEVMYSDKISKRRAVRKTMVQEKSCGAD